MSASDKVGGRVVYENDRVRVWDDTVEPGETQHLHTHTRPYLAVAIAEHGRYRDFCGHHRAPLILPSPVGRIHPTGEHRIGSRS